MKWILIIWLALTLIGPLRMLLSGQVDLTANYQTANRDSAHLAPDPRTHTEAIIQIYSARAFSWRGIIASHCWIAMKPQNAHAYTVYQVIGWRTYHGLPALSIAEDIPDRNWFNSRPHILLTLRGEKAATLIPQIDDAARTYPYAAPYAVWPGPNSNTFPAYVARRVPALGLVLPTDAIGKDYLPGGRLFAEAPSGTGYQFSIFGLLGIMLAHKEGLEINILGLVYGIKLAPFHISLPAMN